MKYSFARTAASLLIAGAVTALPSYAQPTTVPAVPNQATTPRVTAAQFRTADHPRVFATDQQRAALMAKIQNTAWAKKIYDDLKSQADPFVARHQTDPQWIVSRLQMNWDEGKHYTDFYTASPGAPIGNIIPRREGNASYPTVRVSYGRLGTGGRTPIERVEPYGTGPVRQMRDGKEVEVPFEQSGLSAELINEDIVNMAYRAAIVHYFTGDKNYAKFATDIFWTFALGASYQNQVDPDKVGTPQGFLSYETLGDTRRYATLALTYDFIYDYLNNEYFESAEFKNGRPGEKWAPGFKQGKAWAQERIALFMQKFIDNKLVRGGGIEGNWNTNEHQSAMLYAFALDDDAAYANRKGREYYVTHLLIGPTTPNNGPFLEVAKANFNPQTGLWPEAPGGYGQGAAAQNVTFGYWYFQNGIDVLGQDPLLKKAALSFPQIAFPNGVSTGWGDAGYLPLMQDVGEYMIAYARAKGDTATENTFAALLKSAGARTLRGDYYGPLFFFVPELPNTNARVPYPRVSYSPDHSLVFERNLAPNPVDALAYTVYGFGKRSGHRHRNGLSMEIYGRGQVQGVDPGAGPDYWHAQHGAYNNQVGAHNTVVPNSLGADDARPMDLKIEAAEPAIVAGEDPKFQLSPDHQFSDTSAVFATGTASADQRRTMGIVRTGPASGYYVDIFRSRMQGGADTTHDYLYHNMGRSLTLSEASGAPLALTQTPLDEKSGPGYEYFTDDKSLQTSGDIVGSFDFGVSGIGMKTWMPGQEGRTVYSLSGPKNFRYNLAELKELPVPTLLVRQQGEAWSRPFVAVYEPFGNGTQSSLRVVRRMSGGPASGDFVGLAVGFNPLNSDLKSRVDYVLNATDANREHTHEGVRFQGIYGVVSKNAPGIQQMYLGTGKSLSAGGYRIQSADGELVKARLYRDGNGWRYSSDRAVLLTRPGAKAVRLPAAQNAATHFQQR